MLRRALLTTLIAGSLLAGAGCRQAPNALPMQATTGQSYQALARNLLVSSGNKVELLVDADAIFDSMVRSINVAHESVQIHAFQLGGNVGMRLVEALVERHRAGVAVQVLVDPSHGGAGSGKEMVMRCLEALNQAGVPLRDFSFRGMPRGPNWVARLGRIDHSKILVVDGRVAFMGGMNFYDHGAVNHDYMVKIVGPAATHLGEMTNADWKHSGAEGGMVGLSLAEEAGDARVEIAQTSQRASNIRALITRHINQARTKVYVEMLMLDDDMVVDALVGAKQRGVDVRVILDPMDWGAHVPEMEKVPFDGIPNWAAVQDLLSAEVPVYWYGRRNPHENLHAKACSIDDRILVLGSSNFTYRAMDMNRETTAAIESTEVATRFNAVFLEDEARSKRIESLSPFQRRLAALFDRIKRGIFSPKRDMPPAEDPQPAA